jgi:glycosyltransferase EpsD
MARVLVVSHLGRHFRIFGQYDYKVLLDMGMDVHIAANFKDDIDHFEDKNVTKHQIDFIRNPFDFNNLKAYKQLKQLFDRYHFDIIHCQSPTGGAITRLAARSTRKRGSKVIYTAHGFHFYKGAPRKNWILYFGIEKWLAKYTDCIITINEEDYETAKKKMAGNRVELINGVGIDLNKFRPQTELGKKQLREEYGFKEDEFILTYTAELSERKNQEMLIRVIHQLKERIPGIRLLLIGKGIKESYYKSLVNQLGLNDQIKFLGYRNDVKNLLGLADIAVSSSKQEGLPVNVLEAMAMGLPLVVTDCRGNRDLVKDNENGFIVAINNTNDFSKAVERLYISKQLQEKFKKQNLTKIINYSLERISINMRNIYSKYI